MSERAAVRTRVGGQRAWPPVAIGAVCGLAWASGLRAFMVEIAGPASAFDWFGTFEGILLPGVVVGMLFGWAEHLRSTGGHPRRRWLALAPLVFVAATPGALVTVVTEGGIGAGATMPLFGMAGGYALAGRGPVWARAVAGLVAVSPMVGCVVFAALVSGPLSLFTPRGAWVVALFVSSMAVLALACTIPHRAEVLAPR